MPADTEFSDEMKEKSGAYADREEGLGAPISPEDDEMVRALLKTNPTAQAQVDDIRNINAGLNNLVEVGTEVEVSKRLVAMIRAHEHEAVCVLRGHDESRNS